MSAGCACGEDVLRRLAAGLVGRPRVLYLDEPTTGLDPHNQGEVWGVLLTTQYMDEADRLASEIVVIDRKP